MHMYSARVTEFQQGFIFPFLAVTSINVILDLGQHPSLQNPNIPKYCCVEVNMPTSLETALVSLMSTHWKMGPRELVCTL